jgi:hypothetical protein
MEYGRTRGWWRDDSSILMPVPKKSTKGSNAYQGNSLQAIYDFDQNKDPSLNGWGVMAYNTTCDSMICGQFDGLLRDPR